MAGSQASVSYIPLRAAMNSVHHIRHRTSQPILSAILYLHRITDNRMVRTTLENIRVFEQLCGKNAVYEVILITTTWDTDAGAGRLKEPKEGYWKAMVWQGSTTFECEHARGSPVTHEFTSTDRAADERGRVDRRRRRR